jgi:hypothetical protein
MEHTIQVVQLNEQERTLADAVFSERGQAPQPDQGVRSDTAEQMSQLTDSLLKRDAIPPVRLAYFTDPAMNTGRGAKSHKQVFEDNGTRGAAILRHPHFKNYLRHFIYGPDLPEPTIRSFCKIIEADAGTSGMLLDQVKAFVRKEVRDRQLAAHHAAEEFFKLAYEVAKPDLAENVRHAAMSAKR